MIIHHLLRDLLFLRLAHLLVMHPATDLKACNLRLHVTTVFLLLLQFLRNDFIYLTFTLIGLLAI